MESELMVPGVRLLSLTMQRHPESGLWPDYPAPFFVPLMLDE